MAPSRRCHSVCVLLYMLLSGYLLADTFQATYAGYCEKVKRHNLHDVSNKLFRWPSLCGKPRHFEWKQQSLSVLPGPDSKSNPKAEAQKLHAQDLRETEKPNAHPLLERLGSACMTASLRRLLNAKNATVATTSAASTPTMIPAMAPPLNELPDFF